MRVCCLALKEPLTWKQVQVFYLSLSNMPWSGYGCDIKEMKRGVVETKILGDCW